MEKLRLILTLAWSKNIFNKPQIRINEPTKFNIFCKQPHLLNWVVKLFQVFSIPRQQLLTCAFDFFPQLMTLFLSYWCWTKNGIFCSNLLSVFSVLCGQILVIFSLKKRAYETFHRECVQRALYVRLQRLTVFSKPYTWSGK